MKPERVSDEVMQATLRETRMVVERLCQSIGVPDGILRSVTDCGVYSAALGLSGFRGLERQLGLLKDVAAERISATDGSEPILFNANGQHAWAVAEPALDLAVAAYRVTGQGAVVIDNANEPSELMVLRALAEKHGLKADVEVDSNERVIARLSDRDADAPTILEKIVRQGIAVPRELWFQLFHRSHDALAPDTVVSRTHTGSIIIKPDGTIIGKEDPEFIDTDLSMLTKESIVEPAFGRDGRVVRERAPSGG
jgi:hypothetical protein